jgi:Flp pilus assembly protein TadG
MRSMTPSWPVFENGAQSARAFWDDTSGVILPYVTIMLVVIVGLSVLALDGARLMSLQTQLQNGADALALAGAAELDRLPDSETRARTAIERLLTNSTLFGSTNRTIAVSKIQFYSRLPASDTSPMSAGTLATRPGNARFVLVTVRPVTLPTILPAAFFGAANTITAAASAVAGFDQVVCGVTPIYVCNPYETPGMTYDQATEALQHAAANPPDQGRLIRLRQYGGNAPYAAADYGFLNSPTLGSDEVSLIHSIAVVRPAACFLQRGVNFRPGLVQSVREGLNVRFDIYEGSMSDKYNDSNYRPAQNVRKGYVVASGDANQNACATRRGANWPIGSPPDQVTGLPLDRTWPYFGSMGEGNWDFNTYWQVNHGGNSGPSAMLDGGPAGNTDVPSRYRVYRYEIEQGHVGDVSLGGESGAPACYSGGDLSAVPDRRILHAAVINCHNVDSADEPHSNVPVAAFGKFFLILPLARAQTDLYVEMVGLVRPGDGVSFDVVQLYR